MACRYEEETFNRKGDSFCMWLFYMPIQKPRRMQGEKL